MKEEILAKKLIRNVLKENFIAIKETKHGFILGFDNLPKFQTKIIVLDDLSEIENY